MKKEPDDRSKLKIASFRTTDGDWFDFSQVAESNGFTATDVLKACMVDYQAGTYSPSVNTPVSMRLQSAQGLSAEEARAIAESAIEQALVPIREQLSNARVGTHTDLTPDGVQFFVDRAIEKAIAPISIDLAELLGQVSELRGSLDGMKPTSIKPKATKPTTTEDPHPEVLKIAKRLEADPDGLQMSVRAGIAEGLIGKALCEFLFEHGHGANNGTKPFDSSVAGRFVKAIAYLDEQETTPENSAQGDF
jgi:hypothetical protein